jgi:hypothetical protein
MFPRSRSPWDPFRHFAMPPSPVVPYIYTALPTDPRTDDPIVQPRHHRRCNGRYHRHLSHPNPDINDTDHDTDTGFEYSIRHADFEHFSRTQIRLPNQTAQNLCNNDILILSPSMETIEISLHMPHYNVPSRAIRVAAAGAMRMNDVVKQVLPQEFVGIAEMYVKTRGGFAEIGPRARVNDVVELRRSDTNETKDVGVVVFVGGRMEDAKGPRNGVHGWEREMGRTERMRVF